MSKKKGIKKGSAEALRNKSAVSDMFRCNFSQMREDLSYRRDEIWTCQVMAYAYQEAVDICQMVLHDTFKFGPVRQKRFHDKFEEIYEKIKKSRRNDRTDEDRIYSETQYEAAVKNAVGEENYCPRNERFQLHLIDPYGVEHFFKEVHNDD